MSLDLKMVGYNIYLCVCIYMCVYMYIHTCMYVCIYIYTHVCIHTCVCVLDVESTRPDNGFYVEKEREGKGCLSGLASQF